MPTLLFKDFGLVKGVRFDSWRRVGSAMQAVKVYNMREVDELVFLDITATIEGRGRDFETDRRDRRRVLHAAHGRRRRRDRSRTCGVSSRSGPTRSRSTPPRVENPDLVGEVAADVRLASASWSRSTLGCARGGWTRVDARGDVATGRDPVDARAGGRALGAPARSSSRRSTATARWTGYDLELTQQRRRSGVDPGDRVRRRRQLRTHG